MLAGNLPDSTENPKFLIQLIFGYQYYDNRQIEDDKLNANVKLKGRTPIRQL